MITILYNFDMKKLYHLYKHLLWIIICNDFNCPRSEIEFRILTQKPLKANN
jgi:hypothetical protein